MATINQAVKKIVSFADKADLKGLGYTETSLYRIYMDEVGNHSGFNQEAVTEYTRGLPSIINFPYMDSDILSELDGAGVTRKTTKGQQKLIENYWLAVGCVVFQYLKKESKIKA